MPAHEYGERIPNTKATVIIDARENLLSDVGKFLIPLLEFKEVDVTKNPHLSFFKNDFNGFVFSKTLIDELFSLDMPDGSKPQSLVIALGGDKDATIQNRFLPTIMVIPCQAIKDATGKIIITTPNDPQAVGETPPKTILNGYPKISENAIQFELK